MTVSSIVAETFVASEPDVDVPEFDSLEAYLDDLDATRLRAARGEGTFEQALAKQRLASLLAFEDRKRAVDPDFFIFNEHGEVV